MWRPWVLLSLGLSLQTWGIGFATPEASGLLARDLDIPRSCISLTLRHLDTCTKKYRHTFIAKAIDRDQTEKQHEALRYTSPDRKNQRTVHEHSAATTGWKTLVTHVLHEFQH